MNECGEVFPGTSYLLVEVCNAPRTALGDVPKSESSLSEGGSLHRSNSETRDERESSENVVSVRDPHLGQELGRLVVIDDIE